MVCSVGEKVTLGYGHNAMTRLTHVVVAGGDAAAAVARIEMLSPAGYAGLAVSNGLDVQAYVADRQPDIVLLEGGFDDVDAFEVIRRLKGDPGSRHIPIVMLNAANTPEARREGLESGLDDMIDSQTADDIVLARLRPFVRLSTMHAECIERVTTAAEFRIPIALDAIHEVNLTHCRVLFVGADTPAIARAADALAQNGFDIIRETHPIAARERLGLETFDAAIVAVDRNEDMAITYFLCDHIRNTMHLFNLPVLIASANPSTLDDDTPYRHGASMALPLSSSGQVLADALHFLVRRQRLRWNLYGPLTATLQKNSRDSLDGLYGESFLRAHLSRLLESRAKRQGSVSLAVFSLENVADLREHYGRHAADRLMQQVADAICAMVRVEDIAARLNSFEICAMFPNAQFEEAAQACKRIIGRLQYTQFNIGDSKTRFVWTKTGSATSVLGDTADSLIARARATLVAM
jgi:diguanylate cyclase (GGDEF)-like protein